ncbi:class I SAM-dependent methyltransferase [Uruburuella testudinis]|uniref:Class I SAM-dependent methyltransferase n=1 Tax=Uruburuella testudinis TaxID=1282863 RepID=A0ABY4E240_9NEIS|nr:class I SAM-dependent methyltransferase [Uruburuella testudinis]UOO83016.1 class I SAM-dependent methyltransferase [Uruburuella testudinis]
MKAKLKAYLKQHYADSRAHDEAQNERAQCWRNLHPDSAALLALLVRAKQARKVLEVGTSNGYSTLWLADAVRDTGGSLRTLEIDKARKKAAKQHLRETKLDDYVRMEVCDAGEFLRAYQKYYDVVLLDADRSRYADYWPDLQRILTKPGSLLAVDNALSHAEEMQEFVALVEADKNFSSTIVDIGAGLLLASSI